MSQSVGPCQAFPDQSNVNGYVQEPTLERSVKGGSLGYAYREQTL